MVNSGPEQEPNYCDDQMSAVTDAAFENSGLEWFR